MKVKSFVLFAVGCLFLLVSNRSAHADLWMKSYGGAEDDFGNSLQSTPDGGYIVAGQTISFGAVNTALWIVKLDKDGNVEWQKSYSDPGTGEEGVNPWIRVTSDGGYVVASTTTSFGAGGVDLWVVRLDAAGDVLWEKTYGTVDSEVRTALIEPTAEGGFIVLGSTSFAPFNEDIWLLKLDANGTVEWERRYDGGGGDGHMSRNSIQQTDDDGDGVTDDGYFIASTTRDGQATLPWALKLDAGGTVTWQKAWCHEGSDCDFETYLVQSAQKTAHGDYILAGHVRGIEGISLGGDDVWAAKLDGNGNVLWQKIYGGATSDGANAVRETPDGDYLLGAETDEDGLLLKLNSNGNILWQKVYDGAKGDVFSDIQLNPDGGFTGAGTSASFNGSGMGRADFWVAKLNANGGCPGCPYIGTPEVTVVDVSWVNRPQTLTVGTPVAIVTDTEADVSDTSGESLEVCYFGRDLAVTKITAPKSVTAASAVTRSVSVEIQNRSSHDEIIEAAHLGNGTSSGLVRLMVNIADNDGEECIAANVTLDSARNSRTFAEGPKVLKPKKKLKAFYRVTYNCAAALPKNPKDSTRGDYSHMATVYHEVLDGKIDTHSEDDTCPRSATLPYAIDPNPDGTIKERGCASALTDMVADS